MIQPREYQNEALSAIWNYFQVKSGNPVIAHPTGTGKSCIPAFFIQKVMQQWPNQRFLMVTHIKELIQQNFEVMKEIWPNAPIGIYSAGLKQKHFHLPIVYGGIQSMGKEPGKFGHRDICFIDEAHLVGDNDSSQYLTFLNTMKIINPNMKIIGMSATPFRMQMGMITDGPIFDDVIHDLTGVEPFNRMIAEGYLAPLVPKRTRTELDVSNVGMSKGDFIASALQAAADKNEITYEALRETVQAGENRRSWLIFASGIEHSEHIRDMLGTFGIECASVHSQRNENDNTAALRAFKSNNLRSIVSYSKLTTGFNHPYIDLIVDLRPTMSIPLHIQKLGRGTRPAPGKLNCVVLDFSRNVPRLGTINDPIIPRKKGDKGGEALIKICESCGTYNHASARVCSYCGQEFIFKIKLVPTSGVEQIIKSDLPIVEMFDVIKAIYNKKQKDGKPPYIKTTYICGIQSFSENVFPEHSGYANTLFKNWWRQRHITEPPNNTDNALKISNELRVPKKIRVWLNKTYPEILNVEF